MNSIVEGRLRSFNEFAEFIFLPSENVHRLPSVCRGGSFPKRKSRTNNELATCRLLFLDPCHSCFVSSSFSPCDGSRSKQQKLLFYPVSGFRVHRCRPRFTVSLLPLVCLVKVAWPLLVAIVTDLTIVAPFTSCVVRGEPKENDQSTPYHNRSSIARFQL